MLIRADPRFSLDPLNDLCFLLFTMDGTTFRDVMQVVPALALAAAGQVAATALGQCARLLDEHGSTATLLARHAARSAAFYTDDLSVHVAESAHVAATHAAYSAQRQAERFSTITDALAAAVEASVQTAAASAQRCAHRQAGRAAAFADGQAAAANQALQSLAGVLPGFVPPPAAAGVPVAGMYEQQQSEEEQQSDDGSEGRRSSSDGEAFVMVEAELAADGSN